MARQIGLALGDGARCVHWENFEVPIEVLVTMLTNAKVTSETVEEYAEYKKNDKERALNIKESAGAFVGGCLKGQNRRRGEVAYRSILTFDIDGGNVSAEHLQEALNGWKYIFYSTHSHTAQDPHWRVVVILSSDVAEELYEPLARVFVEEVGLLDLVDPVSFRPTQMMFLPSHSKDGEFEFCVSDNGEMVDPDILLSKLSNPHDRRLWPRQDSEGSTVIYNDEGQYIGKGYKSPRDKMGWVGVFCRVYSISEALEVFLDEIYEPTADPRRWTFVDGSSWGGLWINKGDDVCGSHHQSDPINGYNYVNAFDLVRIHLFGDDAPIGDSSAESFARMLKMLKNDERVIAQKIKEGLR